MSEMQKQNALAFRQMHRGPKILLLPNVWDVASARIVEQAGFSAIATSSAGVAFSLGYPDGQKISREEMLARVGRIAKAVSVPVTADVEAGYGNRPEDAALTTTAVIQAGAAGINLEDGTGDPARPLVDLSLQLEKIRAVREAAMKTGVLLVLNARTDIYLDAVGAPEKRYELALQRALAYRDAGADCIFVPGLRELAGIEKFVNEVQCPLNILAGAGSPAIADLEKSGVARVSLGSSPMRATLGLLARMVDELKTRGTYSLLEQAPSHAELNRLMSKQH
jgi:2-methylisocitrate lyase-like PEP mutase family enzyme